MIKKFIKDESGATAIEYGLIAALIALVVIGATQLIGERLLVKFQAVAAGLV
jgi:pilus assembly protein Flp/PilA